MAKRVRRRAVGPPGAVAPDGEALSGPEDRDREHRDDVERARADDERLRSDRPPHHDRER